MQSALRKFGNSTGVIIPKLLLTEIGAQAGDKLDLRIEDGKIVIMPMKRRVREGWAEASLRLTEAGEGGLEWPEFGNDFDNELEWPELDEEGRQ